MSDDSQSPIYYDLQGRRVKTLNSGIYVSKGKKIIIP